MKLPPVTVLESPAGGRTCFAVTSVTRLYGGGMSIAERPLQTPCQWCGNAVEQSATGRLRRYCDRSCRQRAYEARTAQRRLQVDVDAGRVREQPAERIVERVVTAPHPRQVSGWQAALTELAAQLADGRLGWWHAGQLRDALARVNDEMRTAAARVPRATALSVRFQEPVHPAPVPRGTGELVAAVGDRLRTAVEGRLRTAGRLSTSLARLAGDLGESVDAVRQALLNLEHLGVVVAYRNEDVVPVDELSLRTRVELEHSRPAWR